METRVVYDSPKNTFMGMDNLSELKRLIEVPGRVDFVQGNGGLPKILVTTKWSTAEIYLHGAHVTHFQKKDEPPLLFLSKLSRFEENQSIRGGVPIVFPWFANSQGEPMHGFARLKTWELERATLSAGGAISLWFSLPDCPEMAKHTPFRADYEVNVGESLMMRLHVRNSSPDQVMNRNDKDFVFENCLHTYFAVGEIGAVSIWGLKGATYIDKTDNFKAKQETEEAIRPSSEVNRIYEDTTSAVVIHDAKLRRKIFIEKSDSASTVVWNPWIARAKEMTDFGDEEYLNMVCVECGNVGKNQITLAPGKTSRLTVKLSTSPE